MLESIAERQSVWKVYVCLCVCVSVALTIPLCELPLISQTKTGQIYKMAMAQFAHNPFVTLWKDLKHKHQSLCSMFTSTSTGQRTSDLYTQTK